MSSKVKSKQKWSIALTIATCISGLSIAISYTGIFQPLELFALDTWFRLRPTEAKEKRIIVVTINESDIQQLGHWPMSDRVLGQLITKIARQQPRAIGLDIYRDVPVAPGTLELEAVFRSTPNSIGVEKAIGEKTGSLPILKQQDRVALADLVRDTDAKIRRGLVAIELDRGTLHFGLASRLALMYLAAEEIEPKPVGSEGDVILGKTKIEPFQSNDGGYVRADDGGFQILLNYRGTESNFDRVSLTDVLNDRVSEDLMQDRLVLIGAIAPSLNDFFATPYSSAREDIRQDMAGIFIHANIASQIISGALDGRNGVQTVSEIWEWLWILAWTYGFCIIIVTLNNYNITVRALSVTSSTAVFLLISALAVLGSSYLLFLNSIWLPVSPLFSLAVSSVIINWYYQRTHESLQKNLAFIDSLTEIPNRRFFDEFLKEQWWSNQKKQQSLSIILCDVDFFKKYNDTYGHRAGDFCLQQVARVLAGSIRNGDLAARYGGEEFVVVLPNTSPEGAVVIADGIGDRLKSLKIPHDSSQVSEYVSLSCGIASTNISLVDSPEELIECADRALYLAKEQGRDRSVLWEKKDLR